MAANLRVVNAGDTAHDLASRRRWRDKLSEAFSGIKLGVRGQSRFFIHFFVTTLVVIAASILQCDWFEWCMLIGCIGLVTTAELFNSAVESVVRECNPAARRQNCHSLLISTGAILVACVSAAVVGGIVFAQRISQYVMTAH